MNYQQLLTDIGKFKDLTTGGATSELDNLTQNTITYASETLTSPKDVRTKITEIENNIHCGWLTWPDGVQVIPNPKGFHPKFEHAPLEGELWVIDPKSNQQQSMRLNYRDQKWYWVTITLSDAQLHSKDDKASTVLTDTIALHARKDMAPSTYLNYQRIWQQDSEGSITNTDAIFCGFKTMTDETLTDDIPATKSQGEG